MSILPKTIDALVCDFDGVFTDNRVIVHEDGQESVICHRGDGMGIERLREKDLPILVLSREDNKVVKARCDKMKIPCLHGVKDKKTLLEQWLQEHSFEAQNIIYIGNDINDLACLALAGCGVIVADAHPDVHSEADIILKNKGGQGAVRELCDMIYDHISE